MFFPRELLEKQGILNSRVSSMGTAKHIFSHVEWHMIGYRIKVGKGLPKGLIAAKKEELKTIYPLPNAFSRYTKLIK